MLQIVPVINNKGGVGKTTTTVNVAAGLARKGRNVLLVDLDSQGSASVSIGVSNDNLTPSSADVLFGEIPIRDAIRTTNHQNLDLLTGSLELANADVRLKGQERGEFRLADVLEDVLPLYDTILVDCAPSTSILSVNALVAADAFIIPVPPTYLGFEGVMSLGKVVRRVRRGIDEAAPILGLVLTMVNRDEDQTKAIQELRGHYGGKVFDTEIRLDKNLEEAPGQNLDVFRYAPDSKGAKDYANLVDEVEDRIERYSAIYGDLETRTTATSA
jgi:chromosome partitioning protein